MDRFVRVIPFFVNSCYQDNNAQKAKTSPEKKKIALIFAIWALLG
jgi:hypothetical protein